MRHIAPAALFLWLVFAVVGTEIAASAVRALHTAYSNRAQRARVATAPPEVVGPAFVADNLTWRYIELFTMRPGLRAGPEYEIDSFGFRVSGDGRVTLDRYHTLDCRKIWFFGSSTVMGLGVPATQTLPALLQQRLNQDRPGRYCVFNLGMGSQESTQAILLFYELLANRMRPDAVIFYDGVNESVYSQPQHELANHRVWTASGVRSAQVRAMNSDSASAQAVAFIRSASGIVWLARMIRDKLREQASAVVDATDIESRMETMAERYALNVAVLKGIAGSLGIQSFFFWQPAMSFDIHYGFRKLSGREAEIWRIYGEQDEYRRHVAFAKIRTSRSRDVFPVLDLADVFRGLDGELYMDPRHPTSRGNALIADRIYAAVAERLEDAK